MYSIWFSIHEVQCPIWWLLGAASNFFCCNKKTVLTKDYKCQHRILKHNMGCMSLLNLAEYYKLLQHLHSDYDRKWTILNRMLHFDWQNVTMQFNYLTGLYHLFWSSHALFGVSHCLHLAKVKLMGHPQIFLTMRLW